MRLSLVLCAVLVALTNAQGYTDAGCWQDDANRAVPWLEGTTSILSEPWDVRADPIATCAQAARSFGYPGFCVQFGGQCLGSATVETDMTTLGSSTACDANGKGGTWANQCYLFDSTLTVSSGDTAAVRFTVSNNDANSHLVVLKSGTAMDSEPGNSNVFNFQDAQGDTVDYHGSFIRFGDEPAFGNFITIPPASSAFVDMDVDHFWDVRHPGQYVVSATAYFLHATRTQFTSSNVPSGDELISLTVSSSNALNLVVTGTHQARVATPLASADERWFPTATSTITVGCTQSQADDILQADRQWRYLSMWVKRIIHRVEDDTCARDLYKKWFDGSATLNHTRLFEVRRRFDAIALVAFFNKPVEYRCKSEPNTFASVRSGHSYVTSIKDEFWKKSKDPYIKDSRSGILLHESLHWAAMERLRGDVVYGHANSQHLARDKPWKAMINPDNYEFFAEQSLKCDVPLSGTKYTKDPVCYKDDPASIHNPSLRVVPTLELPGQYPFTDPRVDAVGQCAQAAWRLGYPGFCLQTGWQCYASVDVNSIKSRLGQADPQQCPSNGKGGSWSNQCYKFDGSVFVLHVPDPTSHRCFQPSTNQPPAITPGSSSHAVAACQQGADFNAFPGFCLHGSQCLSSADVFARAGHSEADCSNNNVLQCYASRGYISLGCYDVPTSGLNGIFFQVGMVGTTTVDNCARAARMSGHHKFCMQFGNCIQMPAANTLVKVHECGEDGTGEGPHFTMECYRF